MERGNLPHVELQPLDVLVQIDGERVRRRRHARLRLSGFVADRGGFPHVRVGGPGRSWIWVLPLPRVAVPSTVVSSSAASGPGAARTSSTVPGLGESMVTEDTAMGCSNRIITPSPSL